MSTQRIDGSRQLLGGLSSLAALPTVADRVAYSTALDTWSETPLTSFARTLLDDADAATARATLGAQSLGTGADDQVGVWTGTGTIDGSSLFTHGSDGRTVLNPSITTISGIGFHLTPTFNHGSILSALKINPTDTLSDEFSNLLELELGGTDRFRIVKDGRILWSPTLTTSGAIGFSSTPIFNHNSVLYAHITNVTNTLSDPSSCLFEYRTDGNGKLKLHTDGRLVHTITDFLELPCTGIVSTQTWNEGTNLCTGLQMLITDTASATTSKFLDCQVGGSPKFQVDKTGAGYLASSLGVGTSSPVRRVEVAGTAIQLRLSYVAGSIFTDFESTSEGNFRLTQAGGSTLEVATTGHLRVVDGSAAVPAYSFLSKTDSGMFLFGSSVRFASDGVRVMEYDTAGLNLYRDDASTNSVIPVSTINRTSSGIPAVGIGASLDYMVETASNNHERGVILEAVTTSVTALAEDFDWIVKTMAAGAAAVERLRVKASGKIRVGGADIAALTSGSLTDNTGGTADTTLQDCAGADTISLAAVENNFADLAAMVNKLTADVAAIHVKFA